MIFLSLIFLSVSFVFVVIRADFLNCAAKNPSFEAVATLRGAAVKKSNQGDSV